MKDRLALRGYSLPRVSVLWNDKISEKEENHQLRHFLHFSPCRSLLACRNCVNPSYKLHIQYRLVQSLDPDSDFASSPLRLPFDELLEYKAVATNDCY